jgi:hypothetical protein
MAVDRVYQREWSRKQRIDFHIIQPLQCSAQVLRQEMALLRNARA